jgi:hypothetical protein
VENSKQAIQQNMTLGDLSDLLTNMCSQETIIKSEKKNSEDSLENQTESKKNIFINLSFGKFESNS